MALKIDDGRWPVVIFRFFGETCDEDQYAFLDAVWGLVHKQRRFYLVFDVTASNSPNARQRNIVATSMAKDRDLQKLYIGGAALVLASALQRGAATAVFWLSPPPWPYVIVATDFEGFARLNEFIAADGRARAGSQRA